MTNLDRDTLKASGQLVEVPTDAVDRRPSDWPRLATDEDRVAYFREIFDELPPIVVEAETNRLIDGWHRLEAALALGRGMIAAEAVAAPPHGILAASLGYAARAAKPLTRTERRRAIELLLQEEPGRSDRWLASIAGASAATVAAVRAELEVRGRLAAADQRLGRDGRERPRSRRQAPEQLAPRSEPEFDGFDPFDDEAGEEQAPIDQTRRGDRRQRAPLVEASPQPTIAGQDERAEARRYMRNLFDLLAGGLERYPLGALAEMLRQGAPGYSPERVGSLAEAWGALLSAVASS